MCVIFEQEVVNEKIIEKFKVLKLFLKLTNALEAFSMYFNKGVGDEEIAFSSVGRTFCVNVGYLFFDIATLINEGDTTYQNLTSLSKL